MQHFLNIVLYNPEIPQNTGNIARMCVANDLKLHLIEPMGFEISDKHLKRAALDYWQYLDCSVHASWQDFCSSLKPDARLWFFSSKVSRSYWDAEYIEGDYLVFGPETKGLPADLLKTDRAVTIPMRSTHSRSLNLASTVQTAYYEAFRQIELGVV